MKNMNQLNALHGNKTTEPPQQWKSQTSAVHLKYHNPSTNNNPVVLAKKGRINYNDVDNGDFEVYNSDYPLEPPSESVPDPYNTTIK